MCPLYDFVCNKCGKQFELMLPMNMSDEIPICPEETCQSEDTRKLLSKPTVIYRGDHWPTKEFKNKKRFL